jgi:PKD repeat protein
LRDGNAVGAPIAGTGESISFGKQTIEGVYTIDAITTAGNCINTMNGNINLHEIPNPEIQVTGNMNPDFSSNESYVDANAAEGDNVEWVVTGGEIVGINTGASINVDWGNNKTGKIRITKTNAYGCTTTKEIDINLVNTITANFIIDKLTGEVPLEINFTDKSTGYITYWNWEFGDGKMSPSKDPIHIYTVPGKYIAKLTVGYDDIFVSKTLEDTIIVTNKVGVNDEPIVSNGLSLTAIEPNPSSDVIRFYYSISSAQNIEITIYNILGERVLSLSEGYQSEGTHNKEINISQLPSGTYYVQVLGNTGYVNRMLNIVK